MSHGSSIISKVIDTPGEIRPRQHSALWHAAPEGWRDRLAQAVERGLANHRPFIFFRADDIGAGGRAFEAICELFRHHQVPLAMAVVPAWISAIRKSQLFQAAPLEEPLWGWHQHGWRHVNWQRTGIQSEFGEERPFEKQWRDIWQGKQKMSEIFGEHLVPVFTPPWNRLSNPTLRILQELDFKAVSITGPLPRGSRPPTGLKNLRIQIDMHTRKSKEAEEDFHSLLEELVVHLARKEPGGIMIHHHYMTSFAFEFLDELLTLLKSQPQVHLAGFKEILNKRNE